VSGKAQGEERIKIDVYADVVCPWCYVERRDSRRPCETAPDLYEPVVRQTRYYLLRDGRAFSCTVRFPPPFLGLAVEGGLSGP